MRRDSVASQQRGAVPPSSSTPGVSSGYSVCYWNSPVEFVEIRGGEKIFHVFDRQYTPALTREVPLTW